MSEILEPAGDHIIVIDLPHETVIDGIEMPDNVRQQEMVYGTVIFVGPLAQERTKPHDRLVYGPYAGKTIVLGGVQFRSIREGHIEAYVRTVVAGAANIEA